MAALARRHVYVFSVVPRLAQLVQEALPDVQVIDVKPEGRTAGQYKKTIFTEEIERLKEAEVLLADNNFIAEITHLLPNLKWAQGTWAGVEGLIDFFRDKPKPNFPISRMVGDSFSLLMAEYTVGRIIIHERDWFESHQNQMKSLWLHEKKIHYYRSLQDLVVGILGMGNIGKEVARCLKAFRCTVHGYSRSIPTDENRCSSVDKYWHTGELPSLLKECDYVVNIMPSTPETRGMLGGDVLKNAKEGAVLINIGRGDLISETDLIRSLDSGWLSGAILDVFAKEPLPSESPLWKHPKIVISPHSAAVFVYRSEDIAKKFCEKFPADSSERTR
ncbi:glyoxylate/hydroxypyruvate reductase A-like isoform X2 [Penaeus japonicus]|uniref:glyoxylate/hydroxypyruvate reductase A-like isoform X2 n=1 Tax=Penaeus japonicus TaxID=27405 RepID=UPI001C70FF66|nr:glyoxylate/hydroxypyruvate reductase A-like isoform X2 [Penaeus japonicus]